MRILQITRKDWIRLGDGSMEIVKSNSLLHVVVTPDNQEKPTATVIFNGVPIVTVKIFNDEYEHTFMMPTENWAQATIALFLCELGELPEYTHDGELMVTYVNRVGLLKAQENYADQGHEFIAFIGEVCHALHVAYPNTTPEVKGF